MTTIAAICIVVLSVGVFTLSSANNCNVYCVRPTDNDQSECSKQPNCSCSCLVFDEYVQEAQNFFPKGSNTILLFLAGDHSMNTTLIINSTMSHLLGESPSQALVRSSGSRIHCSNEAKIVLNVRNASITGLDFYSCGIDVTGSEGLSANLVLRGNVTFDNSYNRQYASGVIHGMYCSLDVEADAVVIFNGRGGKSSGSGLDLWNCNATASGTVQFQNTIAKGGAGMWMFCASKNEHCTLTIGGNVSFLNNTANFGGALYLYNTSVQLHGIMSFENNSANVDGGAMHLVGSLLYLWPTALVSLSNNHAEVNGGAIYIGDTNPYSYCLPNNAEDCFFQVVGRNTSQQLDPQIVFNNNTATQGGGTLYGGAVDHCTLKGNYSSFNDRSGVIFDDITNITEYDTISSQPFKVCYYEGIASQCNGRTPHYAYPYPGQTFTVPLVTYGQRNGPAVSKILATLNGGSNNSTLASEEQVLNSLHVQHDVHTHIQYTIFPSEMRHVLLGLSTIGPCSSATNSLAIVVTFQDCPEGFNFSQDNRRCICEERLQKYTNECHINDQTILRPAGYGSFWVGHDNASKGLILNQHCPLDYCTSSSIMFRLNETNKQCNANRTGLLCGACEDGLSLVLGTSRCMQCSNIYLLHLVMFAVAGFALVVFFLTCKLTVAVGTISGLIFYANTIAVNKSIFLPERSTNNILTVFLAWVNLDLGIETCFYNGMDAYAKVWLQFVFPFYIWSIIVLVMVVSRFSKRISKLLGSNPIAALTTPVLLSYAKILRTIVFALSFTELEYPSGTQRVWLQDGNVKFLQGRHIALFVSALIVFFVLLLPYTLLLLLGHWLKTKSHLWVLSWISSSRMKFFLDAHYAPYKDEHRYWPGLLLLVQCALFTTAFNTDANVTLLSILTVTLGIATWVWNFGSVFKFWYLNALEGSFILNLGILTAGTQYVLHTGGNQAALTYTSISVALVTFIGIVVYHVCLQVKGTDLVVQWREKFLKTYRQERVEGQNEVECSLVTSLIGSQQMPRYVDFSQPREPLLEPEN